MLFLVDKKTCYFYIYTHKRIKYGTQDYIRTGTQSIPTSTEANSPDQYKNIRTVRIHTQTLS